MITAFVEHAGNSCTSDPPVDIAVADVCRPACRDNADLPVDIPTGLEIAVDDLSHEGADEPEAHAGG